MALPQPILRTLTQAILGAIIGLLLLAAIGWWLAGLTPQWYQPPAEGDMAARKLGEAAEYRLVEEFQKIRPVDEVWRLRVPEEAVNAWLATRLPQWLSGHGVSWPNDLSTPQIRIMPAGIEVAISHVDLGSRIGRFRAKPTIANAHLALRAPTLRLGRLPIALPGDWITPTLHEAIAQTEDLAFLSTLLQGNAIDASLPLVDHRHVRIRSITLEPGAFVFEATTTLNRNDQHSCCVVPLRTAPASLES